MEQKILRLLVPVIYRQPDQRINHCRFSGSKIHATDIDALKAQELGKEFGITGR